LLPWLAAAHTVFLGLLWVLVLDTGLVLYIGAMLDSTGLMLGTLAGACLGLAVLNGVLLLGWERLIRLFDDRWRIGPRVLGTVIVAALIVALLGCLDSGSGYGLHYVFGAGLVALAAMYWIYSYKCFDPAMVCLAALGAFLAIAVYLFSFMQSVSEWGLLGLIVVLMLLSGLLLHRLRIQLRARAAVPPSEHGRLQDPWFMSAFRSVAMWTSSSLIIIWLLAFWNLDLTQFWYIGLLLCVAGLLVLRFGRGEALREAAATVAAAGLFLVCLDGYGSGLWPQNLRLPAILALNMAVYRLGANAALRFFTALLIVWVALSLAWPDAFLFSWYWLDPGSAEGAGRMAIYGQLGVLYLGAVAAFYADRQRLRGFWLPLAWALALSAQVLAWLTPTVGIVLAMGWLVLGFALGRRVLLVSGAISLLACLGHFYYLLDITLLHKAFLLAACGGLLVLAWGLLHWRSRPAPAGRPGVAPWRNGLLAGLLAVLVVVNIGIYRRQQILWRGRTAVLALAPVDPRSLIQGDYMALDFAVARSVQAAIDASGQQAADIRRRGGGYLVLQRDPKGISQLQAVSLKAVDGPGLALEFRLRPSGVRIVTNAYFFPEGQARRFGHARYGEFRVGPDGTGLLTRLLDENMRPL
jgi:uncharacterized membrane-anchored protein